MAIIPRAPEKLPGLDNFSHTHGEGFAKPGFLPVATPIALPDVLSIPDVDIVFNRDDILAAHGGEIHPAIPVLLGLRGQIAERRIRKNQERLEELALAQRVIRHSGVSIIRRTSHDHDGTNKVYHELRPSTRFEKRTAKKMARLEFKSRNEVAHAHGLVTPMNDRTTVSLLNVPPRATIGEKLHILRNQYNYVKTKDEIGHLHHRFDELVETPSKRAKAVKTLRDQLVIKAEAIKRAKDIKAQRKADKKP